MKCLSLTQPWATAVAMGIKRIETRSWGTTYRGPLLIHAAKGFPKWAREFAEEERALGRIPSRLPRGALVARCLLVDVKRTQDTETTAIERLYGDYAPGRFAWILSDIEPLPEPIPARGSLGLWEWEANDA